MLKYMKKRTISKAQRKENEKIDLQEIQAPYRVYKDMDVDEFLREDVQKKFLPLRIVSPKELIEEIASS